MQIETADDAAEAYKSFDDWQYADREAAWKWMFEQGRMVGTKASAKACDDEAKEIRREGEGCTNAQYDWMADGAERCADTLRSNYK
jgi:hypothetical protein